MSNPYKVQINMQKQVKGTEEWTEVITYLWKTGMFTSFNMGGDCYTFTLTEEASETLKNILLALIHKENQK